MQTTANLWEVLCKDLEAQRSQTSLEQHRVAAQKFKEAARQVFRQSSPRLSDALEIAGDVCQASGFLPDAVLDFKDSLAHNLENGNITASARVAAKLALLSEHQGEEDAARQYYSQALELYEAAHDYSQHCMLASNLAGLEKHAGNFPACEKHYLQALETAMRLHGEIHPSVALVCNNLAVAYTEAGDWERAENLHMRALGIREQVFGAMHPDVAQSLANLAVVYHSSSNFEKARGYYEAALKTYLAFKKPDAPELASLKANLEKLSACN
ncbi:MAG: tetratricopeptide repeat protein [Terrimicrobiaceae bacterium]|jgi:tetratricopeptide (TPR) repeat protein|nr:tetratricopeptide repeat protein [Terrimicrobiaceae bacterium]